LADLAMADVFFFPVGFAATVGDCFMVMFPISYLPGATIRNRGGENIEVPSAFGNAKSNMDLCFRSDFRYVTFVRNIDI
jgi:hypothetical protein